MKRVVPVLVLLVLSPLIAEYLLGSLSMAQINLLPIFVLLYGGGAVLVRELMRRAGKGWLCILLLALAYGIIEEGIICQSLFNPHFHGLRLLAYGFVPAIGLAVPWTIDVLALHMVWSIALPIAITELLLPSHASEPWLGKIGLAIIAVMYVAGAAAIAMGISHEEHFVATAMQLGGAALAALLCVVLAFSIPRPATRREGAAPNPWLVGVIALVAGSAGLELWGIGMAKHWPFQLVTAGMLAIAGLMALFGAVFTRRAGWTAYHRYALIVGGTLVYCWYGFQTEVALHGMSAMPAHIGLVVAALLLLLVLGWKTRRTAPPVQGGDREC